MCEIKDIKNIPSIQSNNMISNMKQLPEVNTSSAALYNILVAPIKSKLLLMGIELKVFNHLSEPMSADSMLGGIRIMRKINHRGHGGHDELLFSLCSPWFSDPVSEDNKKSHASGIGFLPVRSRTLAMDRGWMDRDIGRRA